MTATLLPRATRSPRFGPPGVGAVYGANGPRWGIWCAFWPRLRDKRDPRRRPFWLPCCWSMERSGYYPEAHEIRRAERQREAEVRRERSG